MRVSHPCARAISIALLSLAACATGEPDDIVDESSSISSSAQTAPLAGCLPAPELLGPFGRVTENPPTIRWGAVDGADRYTLHVLLGHWIDMMNTPERSYTPLVRLPVGVEVRYWVKAEGPCGSSDYSSGSFVIGEPWDPRPCPDGECFPSYEDCAAVCRGECERRISCGGSRAYKCFDDCPPYDPW
jgi:hypothetical protein